MRHDRPATVKKLVRRRFIVPSYDSRQMIAGQVSLKAMTADIFALVERKLEWIDQRQRVLAQNIANADTPSYQARDVTPFEKLLGAPPITPTATNSMHMGARVSDVAMTTAVASERAPDRNSVNMENELTKVARDDTDSALANNLWKSYMGLYLSALGKGG
jgi:flagellar basal-body rod protein FlgB